MAIEKRMRLAGAIDIEEAEMETITAPTGADLTLSTATGKDLKVVLSDASGSRKLIVKDSGNVTVASIDSDGNVIGTLFTGAISATGTLTGALVGDVTSPADATHDYSAGTTAWTLSSTEKKAALLVASNAGGAADIIGPAENRQYILRNDSGYAITLKKSAGTGVAVANGKTAVLRYSSSVADYVRVTADATH